MNNFYDVQRLLKQFGTIIYVGDRQIDLELMEDEIRELYKNNLISNQQFQSGMLILRSEKRN
ncbi:YqgQ family protein [Halalkalibacillus halophilus]|uniref:YqgQ family protein n=1 Tax=Halalkalibacillus halophilus TaxID=392827 RepID=UPI00040309E9|nr:YqgQ family protein [Halalkalibacillus halophilus]